MRRILNNANPKKNIKFVNNRVISKLPGRVNFKLCLRYCHMAAPLYLVNRNTRRPSSVSCEPREN
jgi:hypothetical protein